MKKSKYKFLEPFTRRPTQRFYLAGVGAYEWMPECIVNRPKGTWDWLFMYFHTPITIMVEGKIVSDDQSNVLCRDIAKKIEKELTYPGQIRVIVIRETRSVSYAK